MHNSPGVLQAIELCDKQLLFSKILDLASHQGGQIHVLPVRPDIVLAKPPSTRRMLIFSIENADINDILLNRIFMSFLIMC